MLPAAAKHRAASRGQQSRLEETCRTRVCIDPGVPQKIGLLAGRSRDPCPSEDGLYVPQARPPPHTHETSHPHYHSQAALPIPP
jgi:hypothetical protein